MTEPEQTHLNYPREDDEIDLREIFSVLWEGKKTIILITSIFVISSVVYSLLLPNLYRSESVLMTRSNSQQQSSASQYERLANLAGISLPRSEDTGAIEVMEIIQSREFIKHLLTFENVLPSIMAAKRYDVSSKELFYNPKIYDPKTKTWISGGKPSYLQAHEKYVADLLSMFQNQKSGLIFITIEHVSPVFAKEFLALIIREANAQKRKKDIDNSSEALRYLKAESSTTPLVEIKESIGQLIESQLEMQMVAKINEEYSLVTIDPPFIPENKSAPNRSVIWVVGTILGGVLSVMIVLIRNHFLGGEAVKNHTSI